MVNFHYIILLGHPVSMRTHADFRGTITYASLNAHLKLVLLPKLISFQQDLSRRDDIWSFYFVILDFFNENIPWRNSKLHNCIKVYIIDSIKDEVKDIKMRCLSHPYQFLWTSTTKRMPQVIEIFNHIKALNYEDKPNYEFIREKLREIR